MIKKKQINASVGRLQCPVPILSNLVNTDLKIPPFGKTI